MHLLAVLRPQPEDVPHLDPAGNPQLPAAPGAGIPFPDHPKVRVAFRREIPPGDHVDQVGVLLVGPGGPGSDRADRMVRDRPDGEPDRAGEARRRPRELAHLRLLGQPHPFGPEEIAHLDLVDLVRPRDQDGHVAGGGLEQERLDQRPRLDPQEARHLLDGPSFRAWRPSGRGPRPSIPRSLPPGRGIPPSRRSPRRRRRRRRRSRPRPSRRSP